MKKNHTNILIAAGLILMATTARIVNAEMGWYNFAPLAALALFSGAVIKDKRYAFLLAILGQFIADCYFAVFTNTPGFYGISQIFTYVGLVAVTALGFGLKSRNVLRIGGFTIAGSVVFFIISNFGHFAHGWNGYTLSGLAKTYIDAIPFFRNSLAGDMMGSALLFGAYHLLEQAFASKAITSKA